MLVVLGTTNVEHHKLYCLLGLTKVLILIEGIGLGLWSSMPISKTFQLDRGDHFY